MDYSHMIGNSYHKAIKDSEVMDLYLGGKTDTQIGRIIGVSNSTIFFWRNKRRLPRNKDSKIDLYQFSLLYCKNYSDKKIADIMGFSESAVNNFRLQYLKLPEVNKYGNEEISERQWGILTGTLLGDAHMRTGIKNISANVFIAQGIKQKDYVFHKYNLLKNIACSEPIYREEFHKKSKKIYSSYEFQVKSLPELVELYNSFYINRKKVINISLLEKYFTDESLAIWFMDDGWRTKCNYHIATMCFKKEEVENLAEFLRKKYNFSIGIDKSKNLIIHAKSRDSFTQMVQPYMIPILQYKIIRPE
jgi:DNA-binding CsgD family transcriptional regulator